ncbi:MAG: hypothetical protein P0116_08470 [Candidatus Nitrosocosmicus sp.]|nr:hypothetical protein [Candidatus Nitrosocosmicus sp.]
MFLGIFSISCYFMMKIIDFLSSLGHHLVDAGCIQQFERGTQHAGTTFRGGSVYGIFQAWEQLVHNTDKNQIMIVM